MKKILIGGSPCTYWSIAQTEGRETKPSGIGWELFENYLIAKEKFKPDLFLYENNVSAAEPIKEEIRYRLGVPLGPIFEYPGCPHYIEINSALVSAQQRKRFYVHNCGEVGQPEDRGIMLRDVLETGTDLSQNEKAYCLTAAYGKAIAFNTIERKQRTMVAERVPAYGSTDKARPICSSYAGEGEGESSIKDNAFPDDPNKQVFDYIAEPVCVNSKSGRTVNGEFREGAQPSLQDRIFSIDGKATAVTTSFLPKIAEPIRIGDVGSTSQAHRVYSPDGKSVTLSAGGGGQGGKTGLYACPAMPVKEATKGGYAEINPGECVDLGQENSKNRRGRKMADKAHTLTTSPAFYEYCGTVDRPLYEVKDGKIAINGKEYPIKLKDGFYIIRKPTVTECCRLQTMPDDYCRAVSKTQAYKCLGNGWTAEVVAHILGHGLRDVPRNEEIVVCSMYDGIATGRYVLDRLGFKNVKYVAYEIDRFAIAVALSNYPDVVEGGGRIPMARAGLFVPVSA